MMNKRCFSLLLALTGLLALAACNDSSNNQQATNSSTPSASTAPSASPVAPSLETNADVVYMTKLGLMKGHMLVAKELLDQQKPEQAEPHIGHPVEEIYADVEAQLKARNVPEFKSVLMQLHDEVKAGAKDSNKVQADFAKAEQALEVAMQAIPAEQRQSPKFVLQVMDGLLDTANAEYAAAIANDKVAEAIEYQDSRGFFLYSQDLYQQAADSLGKTAPEAQTAINKNLGELATAWPSVLPPEKPVKTPDQVSQLVTAIQQETQPVVK